jgi:hypothetical protein
MRTRLPRISAVFARCFNEGSLRRVVRNVPPPGSDPCRIGAVQADAACVDSDMQKRPLWLAGWSDGELPAAAGGSRRGGYPGRAARAYPAAGWLDGHDGPVPGYRIERVHSGMRSAIGTDAAADQGQAADGPLVPDRMRPIRGRSGARSAGRRSGAREGRSPTVRLLSIPARAAASPWARTDLGHVLSPRDQKRGPVDVPTLMPGLPHSAEPQWHIRHGVFSRPVTFTARRPATGSGVIAAARTTAARWPRSGSWRRSGRRPG